MQAPPVTTPQMMPQMMPQMASQDAFGGANTFSQQKPQDDGEDWTEEELAMMAQVE